MHTDLCVCGHLCVATSGLNVSLNDGYIQSNFYSTSHDYANKNWTHHMTCQLTTTYNSSALFFDICSVNDCIIDSQPRRDDIIVRPLDHTHTPQYIHWDQVMHDMKKHDHCNTTLLRLQDLCYS